MLKRSLRCRGSRNSGCGGTDYLDDAFRLGEHRHMAAVEFVGGCPIRLAKARSRSG